MENNPAFCTSCGAPLRESDTFCIACGAKIGDPINAASLDTQNGTSKRSTMIWMIVALAIIWAAYAIYSGTAIIIAAQASIDSALTPDLSDQLNTLGVDSQTLVTFMQAIGVVILVSGIMSLITGVLVYLRKQHTIALILCIIGSILALIALAGIVGLIVAYYLNKSKNEFTPSNKVSR